MHSVRVAERRTLRTEMRRPGQEAGGSICRVSGESRPHGRSPAGLPGWPAEPGRQGHLQNQPRPRQNLLDHWAVGSEPQNSALPLTAPQPRPPPGHAEGAGSRERGPGV